MPRIGYIKLNFPTERENCLTQKLEEAGCEKIFADTLETNTTRSEWNKTLQFLKRYDELVIYSFSNATMGLRELAILFRFCTTKNIRLISLQDDIDSADEISLKWLNTIGSLLGEIAIERQICARNKAKK